MDIEVNTRFSQLDLKKKYIMYIAQDGRMVVWNAIRTVDTMVPG